VGTAEMISKKKFTRTALRRPLCPHASLGVGSSRRAACVLRH
jgi:hypothetical protein